MKMRLGLGWRGAVSQGLEIIFSLGGFVNFRERKSQIWQKNETEYITRVRCIELEISRKDNQKILTYLDVKKHISK